MSISLAEGPVDLVVEADGCMREDLTRVSEDVVLQLRAGLPVRVTVTNHHEVPNGYGISVGLRPASDRERGLNMFVPKSVDATGTVAWTAGATGPHEVFVSVHTTGEFIRSLSVQPDLSRVEVGAGGGNFSLRITSESLERALQQLRE